MKIITCAGYFSSGSSALTDLIAEYDNVKASTNYEFRFLHDIDGISDLEFHLIECHNRHNSGHALKRFEKLAIFNAGNRMSPRYSQLIDKKTYLQLTHRYIEALINFKYNGWWFYDVYDKGPNLYYLRQLINHIYSKTKIPFFGKMNKEMTYCTNPTADEFIKITQRYVTEFFNAINSSKKEYLELDQLVPSSNTERILRYIAEDVFVIIVDRDPRDIFLLEKYYLKHDPVPKDVDLFCKWYRYARESGGGVQLNNPHIIKIQFEDLIYKYEETVAKIEKFTGLNSNNHTLKFQRMNPKRSIVNTQVWNRKEDYSAVKRIEQLLPEFLYSFDEVKNNVIHGIEVNNSQMF